MPRVKAEKKPAKETKSVSKGAAGKLRENGYAAFANGGVDEIVEEIQQTQSKERKKRTPVVAAQQEAKEEGPIEKVTKGGRGKKKSATEQEMQEEKSTTKKRKIVAEKETAEQNGVKKTKDANKKKTTKDKKGVTTSKTKTNNEVETVEETLEQDEQEAKVEIVKRSAKVEKGKKKKTTAATTEKATTKRGRAKNEEPVVEEAIEEDTDAKAAPSPKKKAKKDVKEKIPAQEKKKQKGVVADVADDDDNNVEIKEPKNKKSTSAKSSEKKSRSRKRAASEDVGSADDDDNNSKPTKAKRETPLNSTNTVYNKNDFDLAADKSASAGEKVLKISSWNVAGLRSWLKKDGLKYLEYEEPDIFCLQETKCTTDQLPEEAERIPGYHPYWLCMPGGYAGVAIYSKIMPIHVEYGIGNEEFDSVGRLITAEYEKFYLLNVYVPNSGRKLVNLEARMRWEKHFQAYVQKLDALKPIIVCGDMNCSHQEIDLANPKTNTRSAGFTKEERDKLTELLELGFVDTFRHFYPKQKGAYTYWTYMGNARARNVGWRLDYFIVSERFVNRVVDNCIRAQCKGSDHCPITLFVKN